MTMIDRNLSKTDGDNKDIKERKVKMSDKYERWRIQ